MVERDKQPGRSWLEGDWLGRWILRLPAIERPILFLRWFSLLLVLGLHFFDRSSSGVLLSPPYMILAVAGYNGLLLLLMRWVRWLRGPLNYLALDTVVATLAVYLTGGYHSSFFVLYIFITIGAAFHLDLTRTVMVSLAISLVQVATCYLSPAGLQSPYAQIIISAKVLGLWIVGVLCGLLLEQLRREHQETERERALARHLKALNDLFRHLNTTLDLQHTLQTVAEAPRSILDADVTGIVLLDETGETLSLAASSPGAPPLPGRVHPSIAVPALAPLLAAGRPLVGKPEHLLGELPGLAALAGQQEAGALDTIALVPLSLDDRPLGLLSVGYRTPRALTEEDLSFLGALGQEAALAIRNARLYALERERVQRLRELGELQDAFVSAVTHELRTPLTCIRTSVDLLQATRGGALSPEQGTGPAQQAELLRTIGQHVGRLEALVNDLLEATRLEAGQVTLSTQPTDIRDLVRRVVEALRPLVARRSQTVELDLPAALPSLDIDRRRIEQVLTNILSNAVKFTPKQGRIQVRVMAVPEGIQVCVADNGPGIAPADQQRLFDRFYVVADGRGLSGVGLGLYIARQMVELHGGRIWVDSDRGRGSTFCFVLPVAAPLGQPGHAGGATRASAVHPGQHDPYGEILQEGDR